MLFALHKIEVFFVVGKKIDRYVQTELPKAAQDELAGLELAVAVEPIPHPELIFLQVPLILNSQWDAFNVKVNGSIVLQNLVLLQIPFEMLMSIKAEVVAESPLETPAGNFEKAHTRSSIRQKSHTPFFRKRRRYNGIKRYGLFPHVGIVKVEDEHGVTELITYNLASTVQN